MGSIYHVKKIEKIKEITVEVPGSKSITNRALLLAALSESRCKLRGVLFSDDSRAFLECLVKLGFGVEIEEEKKQVTIQGLEDSRKESLPQCEKRRYGRQVSYGDACACRRRV